MPFEPNARVQLRTAPDKQGRVTGETKEFAGRTRYEVDFGNEMHWVLESALIEPECKKPEHMRLANGLARNVERSTLCLS